MNSLIGIIPIVVFLAIALVVSAIVRRRVHAEGGGFAKKKNFL